MSIRLCYNEIALKNDSKMEKTMEKMSEKRKDEPIQSILRKIKKGVLPYSEIPEQHRNNVEVIKELRKKGTRYIKAKGYDIIRGRFFVEEVQEDIVQRQVENTFLDFESFFSFVEGDIYENACFFQYSFSEEEIKKYQIDLSKINFTSLLSETINDLELNFSKQEYQEYLAKEKKKTHRKKWIEKILACKTFSDFKKTISSLKKSIFKYELLFFFRTINTLNSKEIFDFTMQLLSEDLYYELRRFVYELCLIHDPYLVLSKYDCKTKKKKKELQQWIDSCVESVTKKDDLFFDKETHYFCERVHFDMPIGIDSYKYFETFAEFAEYLEKDLSGCNFSELFLDDFDFSRYKTDSKTIFPRSHYLRTTPRVVKEYNRKNDCFLVEKIWYNESGETVREYTRTFKYFFDFCSFVEYDFSHADLLFCDGLKNLKDFSKMNFENAVLKSEICEILNKSYSPNPIPLNAEGFLSTYENEKKTSKFLEFDRSLIDFEKGSNERKIFYISDLHLVHKLKEAKCKSKEDVIYSVTKIADKIKRELIDKNGDVLIIAGDLSSDFRVFDCFARCLSSITWKVKVIFVLGNHEFWSFSDCSISETVARYRAVIEKNNMYLLNNEILYQDIYGKMKRIECIDTISLEECRRELRYARLIFFGGVGFSGKNEKFNATNGIYKKAITREQEIFESNNFENLYNRVVNILGDRRVIVCTHTPKDDWCSDRFFQEGFVYLSGHTHKNHFCDDGVERIYADNQIGYAQKNVSLKHFYLDDVVDPFIDYPEGIHEISKLDYLDFYRGRRISLTFNWTPKTLYMIKKGGYYCFFHSTETGQLSILNGGRGKNIQVSNIEHCYQNMEKVIRAIEVPLNKYTNLQKRISQEIVKFGGDGRIHGAIVDIDYMNHIYVNPFDNTITAYWAANMIYKIVFPSVKSLLKSNCSQLYYNYKEICEKKNSLILREFKEKNGRKAEEFYFDTDIYRASREIKKMQKLEKNILTTWPDLSEKDFLEIEGANLGKLLK